MCSHPARRPVDARGMSTPIAVPVRLGVERSPSGRDQSFRLRSHIVSSQHDQLISVIEMKASPGRTAPRFTLAVPHSVIDALRDQQRDRCPPTRPLAPRVSSAGIVVCGLFRRDLADDGSGGPDMDGCDGRGRSASPSPRAGAKRSMLPRREEVTAVNEPVSRNPYMPGTAGGIVRTVECRPGRITRR